MREELIRGEIARCQQITRQFLRLSRGGQAAKPDLLETLRTIASVLPLAEVERQYIEFIVQELGGHRVAAAKALGISERSLYRKLKEYDIE